MRRYLAWSAPLLALILIVTGCSRDETKSGTPAEPTTATSAEQAENPLVASAVKSYQAYAVDQTNQIVALTKVFTDAVRAGNLAAAQEAYAPSRVPWERIEPIAGLVEQIDAQVDARVDDFEGVNDPKFTGWHRLEYLLFALNTTEGGAPFADQLDKDVATLNQQMPTLPIKPVDVAVGAAELIEEVSEGKITGEEDRYSKTDLWDFDGNLQGSQDAIQRLAPALREANAELLGKIEKGFSDLYETLAPLRRGDGWVLYCTENDPYPSPRCPAVTVDKKTVDTLKAQLASLSENVSQVAGVLGLK